MNVPSPHQADMLRALVATDEVDLQVVSVREISPERVALGWQSDIQGYPLVMLPKKYAACQAFRLAFSQRDRVHIVNGIWAEPALSAAAVALRLRNARFLNYAEAINPGISRSRLTTAVKYVYAKALINKLTGLLAISQLSRDYYLQLGFPSKYAYDFGYFLAKHDASTFVQVGSSTKLLFIGQLIHRKGVDLLIEAVSQLLPAYPELMLTLIGDGVGREQYKEMAKATAEHTYFAGVLPFDQVRAKLAEFHALILPSRHDGWGVVVNEALSLGVPVIVSDGCGAADLIRDGENGFVFASEDVVSLQTSLEKFLSQSPSERQFMRNAARETGSKISSEVVAPYLVQCIRHMLGQRSEKPTPPWK